MAGKKHGKENGDGRRVKRRTDKKKSGRSLRKEGRAKLARAVAKVKK